MATQRSSFGKLQRDRDKKAKAAAKRVRRQSVDEGVAPETDDASTAPSGNKRQVSTDDLLQQIAEIHQQFDAGAISYEYFEERKADLLGRLSVD